MIGVLARLLIKNADDVKNPCVREKYGILCGVAGICLNVLLFIGKLIAGIFSKSVAVVADAFNNLSDAAASIVTVVGFKISGKKPDKDHPFGHGRMEYIAGLIVSFLILAVGIELFKSSLDSILHPKPLDTSIFTVVTLVSAILVKFYMFFYNRRIGKKIQSAAMEATAKDSLGDTISTAVVLVSSVVSLMLPDVHFPFDGAAGMFVAAFIFYNGIKSIKDTVNPLLGVPADKEFVKQIEAEVMSFQPICGVHDLIVHDYGPGRMMISLHAEVPGNLNIFDLHDVIDNAEVAVAQKFNCSVTIHMDPVDVQSPEIQMLRNYISQETKKIAPGLTVHDIRIVPGNTHTNIIFDAVRPYGCCFSEDELVEKLSECVRSLNSSYRCVIHVDNPFC